MPHSFKSAHVFVKDKATLDVRIQEQQLPAQLDPNQLVIKVISSIPPQSYPPRLTPFPPLAGRCLWNESQGLEISRRVFREIVGSQHWR